MSYFINNQQKVNDIVFAGRNKNYGAYAIRSTYGNTLIKSIIIMMSGIGACMGTAYYLVNHRQVLEDRSQVMTDVYKTTVVNIKEPLENKPKKSEAAPAAAPEKKSDNNSSSNTIADSVAVEKPAVSNTDMSTGAVTGNTATAGIPGGGGSGDDKGDDKKPDGKDPGIAETFGVDSQPEFEGGLAALYRFVSQNVKYPTIAAEDGIEGTVYVKFVVDEKGKVGSLKLLNNVGYGFDDEALRVISKIPNFKTPAMVNGHPVKVYYQLPIKFRLR